MGQRSALSPQQVESLVRLVDRASTREKVPVLSTFTPTAATALQGPSWLERRRTDAAERFAARPLPTEKDEVWRYSRIDELDLDRFHPVSGPGEGRGESLDPQTMERVRSLVERIGPRSALIVSHNGGLASLETSPAADGACSLGLLSDHPEGGHLLGAVASDPGGLRPFERGLRARPGGDRRWSPSRRRGSHRRRARGRRIKRDERHGVPPNRGPGG